MIARIKVSDTTESFSGICTKEKYLLILKIQFLTEIIFTASFQDNHGYSMSATNIVQ